MDVLMPQLGETVAEGKISTWFKAVGDAVKPGDNLFEIETDKVSMEVPAISAGVLAEIRVPAGDVAPVGAIVAVISDRQGATTSPQAAATGAPARRRQTPRRRVRRLRRAAAPAVAATAATGAAPIVLDPFREVRTPERNYGPARLPGGAVSTPLARRLAGEAGIDLSRITGSGPHGRIVARDVRGGARRRPRAAPRSARGPSADQVKALYRDVPYEEVAARQHAPHHRDAADAGEADDPAFLPDDGRRARRAAGAARAGERRGRQRRRRPQFKLSVNDFVIKALALALQRVPAANAVWAEDRILRFRHSDIGVAVAIEGGLHDAGDPRRGDEVARRDLGRDEGSRRARARERSSSPTSIRAARRAISNLGMYGMREFAAIINPPHATILAVGAAQRRPVETADGGVRFVSQMTVTLSCDHRVVDGALGAELLAAFKGFVEQPVTMLVRIRVSAGWSVIPAEVGAWARRCANCARSRAVTWSLARPTFAGRSLLHGAGHRRDVVLDEERVEDHQRQRADQRAGHQRAPAIDVAVDELVDDRDRHRLVLRSRR